MYKTETSNVETSNVLIRQNIKNTGRASFEVTFLLLRIIKKV